MIETQSEPHGDDLRDELEALRKRLQALEAKRRFVGLAPLIGLVLLIGGVLFGQDAVNALFIDAQGNVGIGTTSPTALLNVGTGPNFGGTTTLGVAQRTSDSVALSLRRTGANPVLQWCSNAGCNYIEQNNANNNLLLGTAGSGASPAMVVQPGGNVGIGTTSPKASLDIQQGNRTDTHPAAIKGLYVTGDFALDSGVEFRHNNGTQGIGFGYNTIYATGGNPNQDLNLKPRGNGAVTVQGPLRLGNGWVPAVSNPNVRMRFGRQVLGALPAGLRTLNVTHGETFQNANTYLVLANVSELHPSVGDDVYTTYESHPISSTQFIVRWNRSGGRERQVVINYLVIGY